MIGSGGEAPAAWADVRDAYGSAEAVPGLLAAVDGVDLQAGAWDELWGRLCHQGTVYTASYASLPLLTRLSRRHGQRGYVPSLHLAAGILASTDGPETTSAVRLRYATEIAELKTLAEQNLGYAGDDAEFAYGLQAIAAFNDAGVWQRHLHVVADGEAPGECPDCSEALLLGLEGPPFLIRSFDDAELRASPVKLVPPAGGTAEQTMLDMARAAGRASVVEQLEAVFGEVTCPRCRSVFSVADSLV